MIDFLKSPQELTIKGEAPTSNYKFDCPKCGKSNTIILYIQFYGLWVVGIGPGIKKIGSENT